MTKHNFRVFVGRGKMSVADLETRITDWIDSNAEWVDDPQPVTFTEKHTDPPNSGDTYYEADQIRFRLDDAKSNLVQKLEDKLKEKVAWYRILYDECPHDDGTTAQCVWDAKVEWTAKDVTIPGGVPDYALA